MLFYYLSVSCNMGYLCNQCLSPLTLWVRIPIRRGVLDTTLCDEIYQWLATGLWFFIGTPVSSTNNNLSQQYNWNILESGIKHHISKPNLAIWGVISVIFVHIMHCHIAQWVGVYTWPLSIWSLWVTTVCINEWRLSSAFPWSLL